MKLLNSFLLFSLITAAAPMVLAVDPNPPVTLPDGGSTLGLVVASMLALGVARKMFPGKK